MSNIDKKAQYESKFSRLWERYDEASHGNAEQMRDILEVTLDALESAERQILRLEKLAEAESVGEDKAAASGVEWMKRCLAAEKLIAELETREVILPQRMDPEGYHIDEAYMVAAEDGEYLDRDEVIEAMRTAGIRINGEG
ncbi:hypothetical protein V5028_11375 [Enterobacter hormaechei]|uniref:hypothetical protein n=1 Tax=Enterobacter hormaechei TaxID=158836 RepID=UPI0030766214